MSKQIELTTESKRLFVDLAIDAPNWSGTPLWEGNVGGGAAANGNLTDLKKKGLVKTWEDEGDIWVEFTQEGKAYAESLNIDTSGM